LQPATLEDYLKADGWPYKRVEGQRVWQTGIKTNSASFRIFITLSKHWVFCQMPLSIKAGKDQLLKLYQYLLRKNFEMNLAKFVLEEDGTISLNIELPTEDLTGTNFSDALNMLSAYIEKYYEELTALIQDSSEMKKRTQKSRAQKPRAGRSVSER